MTKDSGLYSYNRFNLHTALFIAAFIVIHYILFGMIFYRFNIPVSILIHPNFLKFFLAYNIIAAVFSTFVGLLIAIIPFYQWNYFQRCLRSTLLTLLFLEGIITVLLGWGFMKILSLMPLINMFESL